VSGSDDNTVRIWSAASGDLEVELKGHTGWVTSVGFSPDGQHVVSGSDDNTVRIWSAASGDLEVELKGHTGWVTSVGFSPDGQHVVSGSADCTVGIWNKVWSLGTPLRIDFTTVPLNQSSGVRIFNPLSTLFDDLNESSSKLQDDRLDVECKLGCTAF